MDRIRREARPAQDDVSRMLEQQRRNLRRLELALEDAVDDVHVRRTLVRLVDDAEEAVRELPRIVDSVYGDGDFHELRILVTDLRLEQRMGRAWTEGPPVEAREPGRPSPRRFGITVTALGREVSIGVSRAADVRVPRSQPED